MGKTKSDLSWPNPNACDSFNANMKDGHDLKKGYLRGVVLSEQNKKRLNPDWVEQLMGLPVGWTQLAGVTDPNENRIDRLRLLGNGVVPQTAEKAFSVLLARIAEVSK